MRRITELPTTHILVAYSASLAAAFDRERFARALHSALASAAPRLRAEDTLTRFHRIEEPVVLGDRADAAMVRVEVVTAAAALSEEQRALARAAVRTVDGHLGAGRGTLHVSAEVREANTWGVAEHTRW